MNPVESRPLRYFIAVAQELNFARAAEHLGIAPPALSRAVAQLEAELGVRLLQRTTRRVTLTPAGQVLLDEGAIAIAAIDGAARRAQRAGAPQHRLILVHKADLAGDLLGEAIDIYHREHAAVPLEVMLCGWGEHTELLREGWADVALIYQPHEQIDEREIDFDVLHEEQLLVALPVGHPLSFEAGVRVADLEAQYDRLPKSVVWRPRTAKADTPVIGDISRLLKLVELGQLVAQLPSSVAERFARAEIAYRPMIDGPAATLAVAWARSSRSLATAAFVRIITDLAHSQPARRTYGDRERHLVTAGSSPRSSGK